MVIDVEENNADLLGLLLTTLVVIGVLLFMIRGARGDHGAARSFRVLRDYRLGGAWAHAILAALALGQIASRVRGGGEEFLVLACIVGAVCGWFVEPNRLVDLGLGAIGFAAGLIGSFLFLSDAPSPSDLAVRAVMMAGLGLAFGVTALLRRQPLAGLTWFAALSIVVFLSSPGGVSPAAIGGLPGVGVAVIGIVAVVVFASAPQIAVRLGAVAVSIVKALGPFLGYFPASSAAALPVILTTLDSVAPTITRWADPLGLIKDGKGRLLLANARMTLSLHDRHGTAEDSA